MVRRVRKAATFTVKWLDYQFHLEQGFKLAREVANGPFFTHRAENSPKSEIIQLTKHWRANTHPEGVAQRNLSLQRHHPTKLYKLSASTLGLAGNTTDRTLAQQLLREHFWTQAQSLEQKSLIDLPGWQKEEINHHILSCWTMLLKKWFTKTTSPSLYAEQGGLGYVRKKIKILHLGACVWH